MRISFVADPTLINSNYRVILPLNALVDRGHEIVAPPAGMSRGRWAAQAPADVLLVHRFVEPELQAALRKRQAEGVAVIWDNDDDIANVPRSNPHYKKFSGAAGQRLVAALGQMLGLADVVTTPSAVLAEQFRASASGEVLVVENHLPDEFGWVEPRAHEGVAVACLAGLEHKVDYEELRLAETFGRLLDAHADLTVLSIGVGLGLRHERYEHRRSVPFVELAEGLSACDIGVAPLVDIPWNQARSNVKLKEYGAAGLAWLASPVGAYVGMGEKQGGRLVADGDWHEALARLLDKGRERRKLGKRAQKWARGETMGKNVDAWVRAVELAAERARARTSR